MLLANAALAVALCMAYTVIDIRGPHGIDSYIGNGIRMLAFGVLYLGVMGSAITCCLVRLRNRGEHLGWSLLAFGTIFVLPLILTDQFLRWYLPRI